MPVTVLATEMLERMVENTWQFDGKRWVPPEERLAGRNQAHDPTCKCAMCQPNSAVYEKSKKAKR